MARIWRQERGGSRFGVHSATQGRQTGLDGDWLTNKLTAVKKLRVVEFYRSADGAKPVGEWLDQLDDERAQAVAMGVKFFEEYPSLTVPKKFF